MDNDERARMVANLLEVKKKIASGIHDCQSLEYEMGKIEMAHLAGTFSVEEMDAYVRFMKKHIETKKELARLCGREQELLAVLVRT